MPSAGDGASVSVKAWSNTAPISSSSTPSNISAALMSFFGVPPAVVGDSADVGSAAGGVAAAGATSAGADSAGGLSVLRSTITCPHFLHLTLAPLGPSLSSLIMYCAWQLSQTKRMIGPRLFPLPLACWNFDLSTHNVPQRTQVFGDCENHQVPDLPGRRDAVRCTGFAQNHFLHWLHLAGDEKSRTSCRELRAFDEGGKVSGRRSGQVLPNDPIQGNPRGLAESLLERGPFGFDRPRVRGKGILIRRESDRCLQQ